MTEPWTPGPWAWDFTFGTLEDAEQRPILVGSRLNTGDPYVWHRSDADARLIAAAPEMAALLELLTEEPLWGDVAYEAIGRARELLARIRGEA